MKRLITIETIEIALKKLAQWMNTGDSRCFDKEAQEILTKLGLYEDTELEPSEVVALLADNEAKDKRIKVLERALWETLCKHCKISRLSQNSIRQEYENAIQQAEAELKEKGE